MQDPIVIQLGHSFYVMMLNDFMIAILFEVIHLRLTMCDQFLQRKLFLLVSERVYFGNQDP